MALSVWQRTIVDEEGNVLPSINIEVRQEIPGAPLVSLYSDREGANPIGNPFSADEEGFAVFYVVGGSYKVRAYSTSFEREWRHVALGTNAETDFSTVFTPKGLWSGATTYALGDMVSRTNGGSPYAFVSNHAANLNNAPPFSGAVGTSDTHWTVIQSPGIQGLPGDPGSSDVVGTSLSSLAISVGVKAVTVAELDRGWGLGARLRLSSDANPTTHFMEGVITDYEGTADLEVTVDLVSGSGSRSDWTINIAGEPGQDGTGGGGSGGMSDPLLERVVTAAGAVTVNVDDEIILLNKTIGAATTVNFPPASTYTGRGISIKDIKGDAQTNNITLAFDGSELCDSLNGSNYGIAINYGEQGVFRPNPNGGWYLLGR